MKRALIRERLDDDAGTPKHIADAMDDLRHINSWFGGIRTTEHMLRQVIYATGRHQLSFLDVGSGAGDFATLVRQRFAPDVQIEFSLLDRQASHLKFAGNGKRYANGFRKVAGDACALPFQENSFDVVGCTLFAHHLESAALVDFVNEALRAARIAVLINDVRRSPLHVALVYASLPLYRSPITWHDAPASVRQAYTEDEIRSVLTQTNAGRIQIDRQPFYRMGVIAWK